MHTTRYRVSVDVSDAGNVLGASIEVHVDEECERIQVIPFPPFDTPYEAFTGALLHIEQLHGWVMEMFPNA